LVRPSHWVWRSSGEAGAEIRGAALLIAILLEGATIIALVFALLFKLA
jgi:F0F1-type ATP synthase membrane subunit c/vacuolar-type H+-ATPase subunit K